MLTRVFSCAVIGLEGVVVEVEVDYGQGLPKITIVGLPDAAVQESRERVYSAIKNAGLFYPRRPLTVNLAPAAVRKEGPAYDLPISLGVLLTTGQLPPNCMEGCLVIGELSLDGSVRHVRGVLPMAAMNPCPCGMQSQRCDYRQGVETNRIINCSFTGLYFTRR